MKIVNVPIQNFPVPADNDADIFFTVASADPLDSLDGNTVYWRAYEQEFGCPIPNVPPVIEKSSLVPGEIDILPSPPMTFVVRLTKSDLAVLLRNYYHEATLSDVSGNIDTVAYGIMTVGQTENRI